MAKITKPILQTYIEQSGKPRSVIAKKLGCYPTLLTKWTTTNTLIPKKYRTTIEKKLKLTLPDNYYHYVIKYSFTNKKFGHLLQERGAKTSLAKHLGVHTGYLSTVLTGKANLSEKYVKPLCKFFKGKVKPKDLVVKP